jgi:predicted TIM-barrel fold metal-dependent hydrolase
MSDPVKVDVHMHLYPTAASGEWWKAGYEIWEYGDKDGVTFSRYSGTVGDALAAMAAAGFAHGIAVNLLSVDLFREEAAAMLPAALQGEDRARAVAEIEATMAERFRAANRWLVDALAPVRQLTPYVGVDPWALSPQENLEHLREMAERGARGIKLHPVAQRFEPDDPRMRPVYRLCEELGLVVLSHTGSAKGGEPFAEPRAFAAILERHPRLTVVLAHLGGGSWRQTLDLARAFPRVAFDLCEIIEWTGAPGAPSPGELGRLIQRVGAERVLLGTDFPWYDLERTVELVLALPVLATGDKERILGANAVDLLGLPV